MQSKLKSPQIEAHFCPSVSDKVLIKDDVSRGQWKFGKVTTLNSSRDGNIRSANLLTSSRKVKKRPLNLLYPIEVVDK
jgi:hypothetical protein